MNKQEVIKYLEKKRETAFDNFEYYRDKENEKYETMNRARVDSYTIAIQAVEQIDEPQPEKVEVPDFVAEWYESHKDDLEDAISDQIDHGHDIVLDTRKAFDIWFFDESDCPIETLIRMKDGYTVKPKRWVVRLDNGRYVNDFQEAKFCVGIGITLEMDCLPPFKFTDKSKAEAVATLVEGSVEEV